jgi:hypothetical protein
VNKPLFYSGVGALILFALFLASRRFGINVTLPGNISVTPATVDETVTLPQIKIPTLPKFHKGAEYWRQTTGLMCGCDAASYRSPITIRQISVPAPPIPHYVYAPPSIAQQAEQMPLTYTTITITGDPADTWLGAYVYAFWGNRPRAMVYKGSDGRIFLLNGKSDSAQIIGSDEYTKDAAGNIYYGPYVYTTGQVHKVMALGTK